MKRVVLTHCLCIVPHSFSVDILETICFWDTVDSSIKGWTEWKIFSISEHAWLRALVWTTVNCKCSSWAKSGDIWGMGRAKVVSLGLRWLSAHGSVFPIVAGGQMLFLPPQLLMTLFAWLVGIGWLPSIVSSFFVASNVPILTQLFESMNFLMWGYLYLTWNFSFPSLNFEEN